MNVEEIKSILPHRYPFLLIDKILEIQANSLKALKNVSVNEPFFQGHYPHEAIMPGVLQIEAIAQAAAIYGIKKRNLNNPSVYLLKIDNVKFLGKVIPGDTLIIDINILKFPSIRMSFEGKIYVNNKLVTQASMLAILQQ